MSTISQLLVCSEKILVHSSGSRYTSKLHSKYLSWFHIMAQLAHNYIIYLRITYPQNQVSSHRAKMATISNEYIQDLLTHNTVQVRKYMYLTGIVQHTDKLHLNSKQLHENIMAWLAQNTYLSSYYIYLPIYQLIHHVGKSI